MDIHNVGKRDRKIEKRRNGHREDGRSVKLLRELSIRKSLEIKKAKNRKLRKKLLEET